MSYFIGIDVGTSATKSVLFDETGKIIISNSSEYELIQPHNGWAQQRPNDWKNAAVETLKSIAQKVNVEEIRPIYHADILTSAFPLADQKIAVYLIEKRRPSAEGLLFSIR